MNVNERIYSVKAYSQAGNKSLHNDNTKRPQPQDTQLGILKIYTCSLKFLKTIFLLKVAPSLLSSLRKDAVGVWLK